MVQQNAARLEHPISRYASCTPGVVDLCVRAVAAEGGLEGVIPDWSGREVALVARGALEALELTATLGDRLMDRELGKGEGDWALTVLAELRFFVSGRHWDRKQEAPARAAGELALAPIEDAAASDDRSPVLFYHDVFFDAAQALVRRGDRMGLVRQLECVAETLHESRTSMTNVLGAVRDLALFHLDLGEHREGLSLLSGLLRHRHSDPWTYNAIAMRFARYGLPSLGRLAAERCLALIGRDGDPERLEGQLREFIREIGSAADRSDAPEDAVKELRDALHVDFADGAPVSPAELADRLVPAAATARVKQLPPRPSDGELSRMAERLRGFLRSERAAAPRPAAAESAPTPAAARRAAKVGRNDPCPCGSGRKFKKCCLE